MTAGALLKALSRRGVRLWARGPHLVVDGPTDALSEELIERLRALKAELLVLLASSPLPEVWELDEWQAYVGERAAIREHDGRCQRSDAERLAIEDAVTHWLRLHPACPSTPDQGCVHCGSREKPSDALLPVLASGGHVWVHNRCWEHWHAARRQQAREALRLLGLSLDFERTILQGATGWHLSLTSQYGSRS